MGDSSTAERYENIKSAIISEFSGLSTRQSEFISLINFLEESTEWLNSPASTKYHCSYPGGLLEHSVNVAETALKIKKIIAPDLQTGIILMLGLLHDCGKAGQYSIKEPTEKQKQYGYPGSIVFNQSCFSQHADKSAKIISNFMSLTSEEFTAILYHDEPWLHQRDVAFVRNKLMTILQYADYWSCLYLESDSK